MQVGIRLPAVAGNMFPVFPVHAQPAILRIWLEAHVTSYWYEKTNNIFIKAHEIMSVISYAWYTQLYTDVQYPTEHTYSEFT